MEFELDKSIEILERTPAVLEALLGGLSEEWVKTNEGIDTWSLYDIIGHLIHGEKTDWIPRMEIILSDNPDKVFQPFDRFAQFSTSTGKTISDLLHEFKTLREKSIHQLRSKNLASAHMHLEGTHPSFGQVTLKQLLSTWVVHDLGHIAQVTRVMAKQYTTEVGPWIAYLRILQS